MAEGTAADHLRLLALVATQLGAKGLEDYQPPAEIWEEQVTEAMDEAGVPARAAPPEPPEDRAAQVAAFVAATGGDAAGA